MKKISYILVFILCTLILTGCSNRVQNYCKDNGYDGMTGVFPGAGMNDYICYSVDRERGIYKSSPIITSDDVTQYYNQPQKIYYFCACNNTQDTKNCEKVTNDGKD